MKKLKTDILSIFVLTIICFNYAFADYYHLATGYDPVWSLDGTRISYAANNQIYTINVDGTDQKQLTDMPGGRGAWGPVYRPGTDQIYYMDNSCLLYTSPSPRD